MMDAGLGEVREGGGEGSVRFVRRYDVTAAELWEYLTEPRHLSVWITPGAEFEARMGGRVRFPWPKGPPVEGTVTVFEPPHALAYVWREGEVQSTVSMRLQAEGTATLLVVEHTGLPLREVRGFAAGWHSHLDWLHHTLVGSAREFDQDGRFREMARVYGYDVDNDG